MFAEIDVAINRSDKVLLIASESSLLSPIVLREIERALQLEDNRLRLKNTGHSECTTEVILPIRIDDFVLSWQHHRAADITKKLIANASNWKDIAAYQEFLAKLINDLRVPSITSK